VATQQHYCPTPECDYYGWAGQGNLRANGHPSGGPWGQWHCLVCGGYFLETYGTPFHGKRMPPERLIWAVAALAEGLGIRAVARVFEVDPHTVLQWLVRRRTRRRPSRNAPCTMSMSIRCSSTNSLLAQRGESG
jgi:transposase-like protein